MALIHPPSIDWELTSKCNHSCIHCYNYWRQSNVESLSLNADTYEEIALKIIEAKPVSVQITGGEPLLVWNKTKYAIKMLVDEGIAVTINTNATLVNDEIAEYLSINNIAAFVSFPCCNKEVFDLIVNCKGAADKAIEGIHKLIEHNVSVSLNMVVTKMNLPEVFDTANVSR